jgi:hypothetical protein
MLASAFGTRPTSDSHDDVPGQTMNGTPAST